VLLTISTTHSPATDISYLLHKRPDRCQSFDLSFGKAHVFYPDATDNRTTAALLLNVDPIGLARNRNQNQSFLPGSYVNDRPYAASSFMSVAIAQVFGSAMAGRCKDRPQLVDLPMPLTAKIDVLPVRTVDEFVERIFEPLGYQVSVTAHELDWQFPDWGRSPYASVTLHATTTLSQLLTHLYVLIPVFDNSKHYYVGEDEVEKLLEKGEGWLATHPERDLITRRSLRHRPSLFREALARLADIDEQLNEDDEVTDAAPEVIPEPVLSLNAQRIASVLAILKDSGAKSVIDLGCGEGRLLRDLAKLKQFERIAGMDVSVRTLEIASEKLRLEPGDERLSLIHGSLMYRDKRLAGFEAASVVEVIEHLDPPRLSAFERVVFEFARPRTVVVTTPNREYNVVWESLPAGRFRHGDHRFEWTRVEFQTWAEAIATRFAYKVKFHPIGPLNEAVGSPTQMAVFKCCHHAPRAEPTRKPRG
jgi:3' terminal RNA ribose 2'-O-methyltransferase Hen1